VPEVRNHANTTPYSWGDGCEGWRFVTEKDLAVVRERMPPGASEKRHYHERARQVFVVLNGALELEIHGRTHVLLTGDAITVAPGLPHSVRNSFITDTIFLVISSPSHMGDRVETERTRDERQ